MEAPIISALILLARRGVTSYERLNNAIPLIDKVKIESLKDVIVAKEDNYIVKISQDGTYVCSCPDFQYRKKLCKHILATLLKLNPEISLKIIEKVIQQKPVVTQTFSTGIKDLDDLAPIPTGVIGVIGPSKVGKTLFVTQITYKISADTKKSGLYIDTEGFYTPEAISNSETIFGKRFGQGCKVEFLQLKTLESLLAFLGLSMSIEAKEKKVDITVNFTCPSDETPVMRMASFLDISAIAIDSFTMPIKRVFGSGTQNLPARSALINGMFARLEELSSILEIPVFITHHVAKSPINPYDPYKPYGGSSLLYNLKHILMILAGEKPDERRVIRYVWPYKTKDEITLKLVKDYGYTTE
jgi:predicted nucleic acid-binding Zn finger protein